MFIIPQLEIIAELCGSSPLRINIHLWFVKWFLQLHFYWLCRRTWLGRESLRLRQEVWNAAAAVSIPIEMQAPHTPLNSVKGRWFQPVTAAPGSSERTEVTAASIGPVVSNCYPWNNKATKDLKSVYSSHVFRVSEQLGTFLGLAMRKEYWKNC